MQRLCNARKKTLLWGEHGCVLTNFTKMYAHTDLFAISQGDSRRGYFESGEDPNQWIALHDAGAGVRSNRDRQFGPHPS